MPTAEQQLESFIAKFSADMAARIRLARAKMRKRIPQAVELVYDNYNFFVIGYGPDDRAGQAIFSLAAHAKGLSLCFLQGAGLLDPLHLLTGSGKQVRNIRLDADSTLDRPEVCALIELALQRAKTPLSADGAHRLIIKSVSVKQRPRRLDETNAPTKSRSPGGRR